VGSQKSSPSTAIQDLGKGVMASLQILRITWKGMTEAQLESEGSLNRIARFCGQAHVLNPQNIALSSV
jgi:hypothetical protein